MWWKMPTGPERDRLKAETDVENLTIVIEHPGNIIEVSNGLGSWLQGPSGYLHPVRDDVSKRMAMLAAQAGMSVFPARLRARLIDGRLAVLCISTRQLFYLHGETPIAYRMAIGRALYPHPSKKQFARVATCDQRNQ